MLKINRKYWFYILLMLISCDNGIDVPNENKNQYVYSGEYFVNDLNMYSFSKLDFNEDDVLRYWPLLDFPECDTLELLYSDDTLRFKYKSFNPVDYKMSILADTIHIFRNDGSLEVLGFFNNNDDIIVNYCYIYKRVNRTNNDILISKENTLVSKDYNDFFNKESYFSSPENMNLSDTIAWCNVYYKYIKLL